VHVLPPYCLQLARSSSASISAKRVSARLTGRAGSLVIVLVWVYYLIPIVLLCAISQKSMQTHLVLDLDAKLNVHPPKPESVIVSPATGLSAGKGNEEASVKADMTAGHGQSDGTATDIARRSPRILHPS